MKLYALCVLLLCCFTLDAVPTSRDAGAESDDVTYGDGSSNDDLETILDEEKGSDDNLLPEINDEILDRVINRVMKKADLKDLKALDIKAMKDSRKNNNKGNQQEAVVVEDIHTADEKLDSATTNDAVEKPKVSQDGESSLLESSDNLNDQTGESNSDVVSESKDDMDDSSDINDEALFQKFTQDEDEDVFRDEFLDESLADDVVTKDNDDDDDDDNDDDDDEEEDDHDDNEKEELLTGVILSELMSRKHKKKHSTDPIEVDEHIIHDHGNILGDHSGEHVDHGDIMFRECEEERIFGSHGNMNNKKCGDKTDKRSAENDEQQQDASRHLARWPQTIPYETQSLGAPARIAIAQAIGEYALKTCLRFRIRNGNDRDYLSFHKGSGCWSYVGKSGGKQLISIGAGCEYKPTAVHEIMHAIGFWHEQSRPDRDNYVTILLNHVISGKAHNFDKRQLSDVNYYDSPYDYGSVMHYSKTAFGTKYHRTTGWFFGRRTETVTRETIRPKRNVALGNKCSSCGLSKQDAFQVNRMYCENPLNTIDNNYLRAEVTNWIYSAIGESNSEFRYTLRNHLSRRYPKHYFTVSSYNGVSGFSTHTYYSTSRCVHAWRTNGKNVVVCYSLKTSRYPSTAKRNTIATAVLNAVNGKYLSAYDAAKHAWNEAVRHSYPITMVHVVRFGSGLRTTWTGYTSFQNYVARRDCSKGFWLIKGKCTNHESSLVIMFG